MTESPIKRHDNIAPLSREHHGALLFSWKLKQGVKNGTSTERIKKYISWFWKHHLLPHQQTEEEVLFTDATDPLVKKALEEHTEIRDRIDAILVNESTAREAIPELAELNDTHIRYEERELFPHLEKKLSLVELERIGQILLHNEEHSAKEDYDDPFWEGKK